MKARPQDRFSGVARNYAEWRPSYPRALFERVAEEAQVPAGATVVDAGCGTGISTRLWASLGYRAVGVEPNDAMRAEAEKAGGAEYLKGEAEATTLPGASADLAAAAQAFHWFDLDRALAELARILKPRRKCAAIWNQRARTPFLKEYEELLKRYTTEYAERPKSADVLGKIERHARVMRVKTFEVEHAQRLNLEGFFGRVYSASYVSLSLTDKAGFDAGLEKLFEKYQKDGAVDFAYRAVAVVFGLR
jgi:ubiquinone/menaquinone biosynthesis C-methylase UbiE